MVFANDTLVEQPVRLVSIMILFVIVALSCWFLLKLDVVKANVYM